MGTLIEYLKAPLRSMPRRSTCLRSAFLPMGFPRFGLICRKRDLNRSGSVPDLVAASARPVTGYASTVGPARETVLGSLASVGFECAGGFGMDGTTKRRHTRDANGDLRKHPDVTANSYAATSPLEAPLAAIRLLTYPKIGVRRKPVLREARERVPSKGPFPFIN